MTEEEDDMQKVGLSRFGSPSIIENLGLTLILLNCILLLLALLVVIAYRISKRIKMTEKKRKLFVKLHRSIFYNPLARFYLLNILKLDMIAMVVLAGLRESNSQLVIAVPMLIVLSIVPFIFTWCIFKNKETLNDDSRK